ncbi:MAG TPA: hypothetical protein VLY63_33015 [Anaerolineae bacterium]|nr:hypothetical protein [Anaerolineae bacterium]
MSAWDQLWNWWRSLFPPIEEPETPPVLRPRVLLITFNPVISSEAGRKLTQVLGWRDVNELCKEYIADLRECSNGFAEFQIVQQIEVDAWPAKVDGFRYDEHSFLQSWRSKTGFHEPDAVDYGAIIDEFDLLQRVNSDQIDEVWLFAFPYAGFYESIMIGPGAFWCNAPEIPRTDVSRRFVIMGFNYERGVGPMLESFGHRVESIMRHTWRHQRGAANLWEQFILYDKKAPGKANCGWMHYAPNSETDYDWGNRTKVLSNCDDWLNFPNFKGTIREVDCSDWGNGDMRAHHKWWYKRLPNAPGHTRGISNNWWWYGVDPNAVP